MKIGSKKATALDDYYDDYVGGGADGYYDDYYDDYYDEYAQFEEDQLYGDKKGKGGGGGGGGHKAHPNKKEYNYEEEKKIDPLMRPKKEKKKKRRPSIDLKSLDPSTFKEKFGGFNKDDYKEVLSKNSKFFEVGYSKYIDSVHEVEKLLEDGYRKEDVDDPLQKELMSQLCFADVRKPSFLIEQANIRKNFIHSFHTVKEANKSALALFCVNIIPKCFKEELKEKLLVEYIEIYVLQKMNEQESDIYPCFSIRNTAIPKDIKDAMENVLFETSKNLKNEKVLHALKLVELYLPDMMKTVHEKLTMDSEDFWAKNELRKLTAAKEFYPLAEFIKQPEDRWKYVAGFVNTKSLQECKSEVKFQEGVKKDKADKDANKNGKTAKYVSADTLGLQDKEESKEFKKEEEEDDEDDWTLQERVKGSQHEVDAAKSALQNSTKTLLLISNVEMIDVAAAGMSFMNISCMCIICGLAFKAKLKLLDTKDRLLNYSRPCYKCKSKIVVICNFNLIHIGNQYDAGSLVSVNTKLIDINSVSFDITCDH